jgi:RNA polymerase sigma-70 factor, ECF subfamily
MDEMAVEGAMRADAGRRALVGGGKVDAFAELTERQLDQAYRLAWAILGNDQEAQDATQDALTRAWRERRTLRDPDKLDAWFSRILVNRCRDLLRSRARSRVQPLDLARLPWVPDATDAAASRDELGRALESLNPDQRIVVVLRFWADLTVDAIAERLAVPAGTVKSRLHNSLQTLRASLEDAR